jgi:2-dehydro-3-deoxyphosphooctonate aldolase (KDO 8-P synthase)
MALAAKAFGANGYFFETHPDPEKAMSDGPNMLYLSQVEGVLRDMIAINDITRRSVSTAK